LYGICCLFALTALGIAHANGSQGTMLLVGIGLVVFVLIRKLGYLSARELTDANGVRRRNIQLRSLVKQVNGEIAAAHTIEQIWRSVRPLADALQASSLELLMERTGSNAQDMIRFETHRAGGAGMPLSMSLEISWNERRFGSLGLAWRDGRREIDRDEELALEVIADAIGKAARMVDAEQTAQGSIQPAKRSDTPRVNLLS